MMFKESDQLIGNLLGAVLDEEVAGLESGAGHLARPGAPHLEHVAVEPRQRAGRAAEPERAHVEVKEGVGLAGDQALG
jgi:hypothetical protein